MENRPLDELLARKEVRFLLAALCGFFAGQGGYLLLNGTHAMDIVRGGGEVLLWGSLALLNLARIHGGGIPGIRLAIYVGAGLIVASWLR